MPKGLKEGKMQSPIILCNSQFPPLLPQPQSTARNSCIPTTGKKVPIVEDQLQLQLQLVPFKACKKDSGGNIFA
ncbi:hypothetical protein GOP47_0010248 [Adiantum capillus-veneris]|uniref:Uncharacterized protein n=1 Tax=Adiantum capillus-veneris TaxID=13818 RepID=A0A9D4ZHL0_ADICA|nr:hypothetical protein GOP47_0010248 [Adiantum capillus-veneris]